MIAMSVARYFEEMSYGPAPEADTEARAWLKRHGATFGHFIDGAFVATSGNSPTLQKNLFSCDLCHCRW